MGNTSFYPGNQTSYTQTNPSQTEGTQDTNTSAPSSFYQEGDVYEEISTNTDTAKEYATEAAASATAAANSAFNAAASDTDAQTQATNAAHSASAASSSATAAAGSATAASGSASTAGTQATNAANSASAASTSASNASTSATNAANSASAASTSAGNAATDETNASNSASAAATSASNALTAYNNTVAALSVLSVFSSTSDGLVPKTNGVASTDVLTAAGTWAAPAATGVTQVQMTVPTGLTVSGSPITSTGTFALSWSGTIPYTSLPAPTTTTIGGVKAVTAVAHQWVASIDTTGTPHLSQPAFTDISGTAQISQGGTGQTTALAARGASGLNLESLTTVGDANYTMLATDRVVWSTTAFTAPRTWTLPLASSVNPGHRITMGAWGASTPQTLTLNTQGTDVIWVPAVANVSSLLYTTGTLVEFVCQNGGWAIAAPGTFGYYSSSGTFGSGLVPPSTGTGTKYLLDTGVWGTPAASGGVTSLQSQTGALTIGYGLTNSTGFFYLDGSYLGGYISGLNMSAPGSSQTLTINTGSAAVSNFVVAKLTSTFTKAVGTAWAAGSGNGALDTGTITASTWYHVHLIMNTSSGAVDILVSVSATSPTLPSGYGVSRRIGSFQTDGSKNIIAFVQNGDNFHWAQVSVYNSTAARALSLLTISVPPGVVTNPLLSIEMGESSATGSPTMTMAPGANSALSYQAFFVSSTATVSQAGGGSLIGPPTNTSSQIYLAVTLNSGTLGVCTIWVTGWIDTRGR